MMYRNGLRVVGELVEAAGMLWLADDVLEKRLKDLAEQLSGAGNVESVE